MSKSQRAAAAIAAAILKYESKPRRLAKATRCTKRKATATNKEK